jgi:proteic killer suppression protein
VIYSIVLSENAKKDLRKVPSHIFRKLLTWVEAVELRGLEEVRKISGYHDEPLHGG